jgi:hypothetical protein
MSMQRFTPELRQEAVSQIVERGHSAADCRPAWLSRIIASPNGKQLDGAERTGS